MAKFGLFSPQDESPIQVYEGDYLVQNGKYVQIANNEEADELDGL